MSEQEKFLLLEILVADIRCGWTKCSKTHTRRDPRAFRALRLAADLYSYDGKLSLKQWDDLFCELAMYISGRWEGKVIELPKNFWRTHGLSFGIEGRSEAFQNEVKKYIITEFSWDTD